MTPDALLATDPVFQLNVFLWALEDLPNTVAINPVLRKAGYKLSSIGRRLLVPGDEKTLTALRKILKSTDLSPCHPDLYLHNAEHSTMIVLELKSHGFSINSSNTRQATKLIISAHNMEESFAETCPKPGHVVYGTVENDASNLAATLHSLEKTITSTGVHAAPTAVIGISVDTHTVKLSSPKPHDLPQPAERALETPATILRSQRDNDVRPLYFIPWIPGIEKTQNPELQKDGYRELTARVIIEALVDVGQAILPTTLEIRGENLLRRATFGVFDQWLDVDRKQFIAAAVKVINARLRSLDYVRSKGRHVLTIELSDTTTQNNVLKLLEQSKPEDVESNIQGVIATVEQATLFD